MLCLVVQFGVVSNFGNSVMDGEITLDNKTTFYINKSPGYLHIKFDKEKNSNEVFSKIKFVCAGINDCEIWD